MIATVRFGNLYLRGGPVNLPPPTDEVVERAAMILALAKEGHPEWPPHLSPVERDIYRVKAMEMISLLRWRPPDAGTKDIPL